MGTLTHKAARAAYGTAIDAVLKHVKKDREKGLLELVDLTEKYMGDNFQKENYEATRKMIQDPDNKWVKYVNHMIDELDPYVIRQTALNLGYEAAFYGTKTIREMRKKYDCNIPWLILMDPTSACNLHCTGCWAAEMLRVKNFVPAISLEGFEEVNDLRRGAGVYEKVLHAMDLLKASGQIFGTSICYTSKNIETVTSDEFLDMIIEKGCRFTWYFHYMPVGNDAAVELLPTKEQREYMYHRVRKIRSTNGGKPIFAMDFQNDGEFVGGCIAGGRNYCHINPNGDVEPCVFIHYSGANIKEVSLLDALRQPLFMAYRDHQPFNCNHLKPCPMLENPELLQQMVHETGAKSTDLQSPETVEHLCGKCHTYAKCWSECADKLWSEHPREAKGYQNYKQK